MLSVIAVLASLGSASVEFDFRITNSRELQAAGKNYDHLLSRRGLGSNETVEPVINATLTPSYNFYFGNIQVGQPPQQFEVLMDTGSPVSWLYGPEKSYHNASRYHPNRSLTHKELNNSFSAEYGSGIYIGHWYADIVAAPAFVAANKTHEVSFNRTANSTNGTSLNMTWDFVNTTEINGTALEPALLNSSSADFNKTNITLLPFSVPFQFGVVSSFSTTAGAPGLLGLGPHIESAGPETYLSLPEAYKKYNVTSSSAFSVFLEKDQGRFIFGGADLKYAKLPFYRYSLPTDSSGRAPTSWHLRLDSLTFDSGAPYPIGTTVTLDTGSPVSLLPQGFVDAVGQALNFTKHDVYPAYYTNDTTLPKGTITFNLHGGLQVEADISKFLVPGNYIWLDNGPKNATALSFIGSSSYLLGDAFFRSTYTILDPANGDVMVAKRSNLLINATNSTNASTVVPIQNLMKNGTAVVNVTNDDIKTLTTSVFEPVTTITVAVAPNEYLGTVPADKQASLTATATRQSSQPTSSAASKSSASSSHSSSSQSKNAGVRNKLSHPAMNAFAFLLLLI